MAKKDYFSVHSEPALEGGACRRDPSENRADLGNLPTEEEALRDSVANEPALADRQDPERWRAWHERKRRECSLAGNLMVTLAVAVATGPAAVVGAFLAGSQGATQAVYAVVFGPIVEELLKQGGMIYLLERRPYRIFASWQFPFAALAAGLAFATIENLMYLHVYAAGPDSGIEDFEAFAAFRWTVCTALHVVCALIASTGLIRAWRRHLADGQPVDLSAAYPLFAVAMAVHGVYNLVALFIRF